MSVKASQYDDLINAAAQKYGLDPALIHAVIEEESGYDPKATSKTGAQGLMQLEPPTAKEMGATDAYDPAQNIDAGSKYLAQLMSKYGNEDQTLAAYNWGPGNLDKNNGKIPDSIQSSYVDVVKKKGGDGSSSSETSSSSGAQTPSSAAGLEGAAINTAESAALKHTMKGTTGSLLAQAPGTTAFGSSTLGAALPALGVVAGAYTGSQQLGGAEALFAGKKPSAMQEAALFGVTGGLDIVGQKLGLFGGGGKSKDQMQRDQVRKGLQGAGFLDKDWNATLADGSMYDLGKDGHAKLADGRGVAEVNFDDKLSGQTVGWTNPIAAILAKGDKDQTAFWAGDLANASQSNASDLEGSRKNVLTLATRMGLTQDTAVSTLKAMKDAGNISNEDYNAYVYGVGTLFSGKYDKNAAYNAYQASKTKATPTPPVMNDLVGRQPATTNNSAAGAIGKITGQINGVPRGPGAPQIIPL